jgi:predicted PurR-regulated permease PerM
MSPGEGRVVPSSRISIPLVACLVVVLVLAFVVFRFFLLTFTIAASLALLMAPAQRTLSQKLWGMRSLSASLLVLVVITALLLPLLSYATIIAQQAQGAVEVLRPHLEPAAFDKLWRETLPRKYPLLMAWVRRATGGTAVSTASAALSNIAAFANHSAQSFLAGLANVLLDFGIFVLMLFFMLRDGSEIRDAVRGVSPLTRGQELEIVDHLTRTVKGILQSMVLVPLAQGVVALVGFWAFGVPAPLLWSLMVVFAALIPIVGSPLAWVPAALYLMYEGSMARGLGLLVYGAVLISGIDNVIKPLILKGAAQIHMLLAFLSILGGIMAFGPKGLIVGPVVLSLVLSAYRIYRYDVLRWRKSSEAATLPSEAPAPKAVSA